MHQDLVNRILIAGVALAGASTAMAQITAPSVTTPPPPKWESSATLGLSLTKGNSDTTLFTGKILTQRKAPSDEWYFGVDGSYGKDHSVKNNEMLHGFGQYNHLFSDRFYAYGKVDGFHDGIADIKYRFMFSPGAGYYFIKEKATTLSGEVGPAFIKEKVGGTSRSYMTLRVAERFEHKFSDRARMWQSAEFLPQVDDFNHYLLNAEIGAAATLVGNLELTVYLQDNYNSRPALGKKENDIRLVSGVTYKF